MRANFARYMMSGLLLFLFATAEAFAEPYPWEMLKDSAFTKAYRAVLGARIKQRWLAKLDGPANPVQNITVGGSSESFVLVKACKPHNCNTDNIVILYSPKRKVVYAKLIESYNSSLLGNPSPEVTDDVPPELSST